MATRADQVSEITGIDSISSQGHLDPRLHSFQSNSKKGAHYQGPVFATRVGTRRQDTLDVHFKQHGPRYFTKELHHIDCQAGYSRPGICHGLLYEGSDKSVLAGKLSSFRGRCVSCLARDRFDLLGRSRCIIFGKSLEPEYVSHCPNRHRGAWFLKSYRENRKRRKDKEPNASNCNRLFKGSGQGKKVPAKKR